MLSGIGAPSGGSRMKTLHFFSNLRIRNKFLVLFMVMTVFLASCAGAALYHENSDNQRALAFTEQTIRNDYDRNIKNQVNSAVSLLNGVYGRYQSGEMTLEESKQLGADLIRGLRYGSDGYFWVDTVDGINVVMQGSEIEGTNRFDYRDIKGTLIFQQFIQKSVRDGGGYVDYWFPRSGQTQPVRKRGYSELFQPFGWVVGTGDYIDDIDREIAAKKEDQNNIVQVKIMAYLAILLLFSGFAAIAVLKISKNISVPLQEAVRLAGRISDGVMDVDIEEGIKKRKDEIGELAVSLEKMRDSLRTLFENLKEKADALSKESEFISITLASVGDGVISTDSEGNVLLLNRAAEQMTGWKQEDAAGKKFEDVFETVSERTWKKCASPVEQALREQRTVALEDHAVLLSKSGKELPVEDSAAPILDRGGRLAGAVLVFRDVTEKKKKMEQIRYIGYHDPLTGLYNRTFFEKQLKSIDTPENLPISLIMADVNGLKLTNDAYGHAEGDWLIQKAAEILRKECRESDIVARVGGDEFVILLKNTGRSQAQLLEERIRDAFAGQDSSERFLSVSLGSAEKTEAASGMEHLLQDAEDRMYRRKLLESEEVKRKMLQSIENRMYLTLGASREDYLEIGKLCGDIGAVLHMDPRDIPEMKTAGKLHDIGKVTVSREILYKTGSLTEKEWTEIRRHPEAGYHILKSLNEMARVAEYVLAHHERWDGQGYPKGLKGEEIPLPARIICIADAWFAMVRERPYRKAIPRAAALQEIRSGVGSQFDPGVVRAFLVCVGAGDD